MSLARLVYQAFVRFLLMLKLEVTTPCFFHPVNVYLFISSSDEMFNLNV